MTLLLPTRESDSDQDHTRRIPGWLPALGTWLSWTFIGVVGLALTAVVIIPKAMGWVPLTVLTGSMTPTIPIGSQVVVERIHGNADLAELQTGDIITFLPKPDSGYTVTHRIVAKATDPDGTVRLRTRGDANNTEDPWELTAKQVRGKAKYWVPWIGYAARSLPQEQKDTGIWIISGALFLYAGHQLFGAVRSRRGRGEAELP